MSSPESRSPATAYREADGYTLVELRLRTLAQLYNSLDPAPFHERDLDDDAVEYLRQAIEELSGRARIKLRVELQEPFGPDVANQVVDAIRNDFGYRARTGRMALRHQLRIGRFSLAVGLLFMATCLELRSLLPDDGGLAKIVREGVSIIGWVAMWKPLDIFLYSWWPLLADIRRDERIASLPIEVVGSPGPALDPARTGGAALDSPGTGG